MFLKVKLTIFHHWFIYWLGAEQWWLVYWRLIGSLGLNGQQGCFTVIVACTRLPRARHAALKVHEESRTQDPAHLIRHIYRCCLYMLCIASNHRSDMVLGLEGYVIISAKGAKVPVAFRLCECNGINPVKVIDLRRSLFISCRFDLHL